VENWHIPILYYFGIKNGESVIQLKNGLKCIIRDKSDSIAFFENFFININFPTDEFWINDDDTIIDVGAHIGTFTLLASSKAKNGKIISIEPSKESFKIFEKNVNLNDLTNVNLMNYGVWSKSGKMKLYINEESIGNSIIIKSQNEETIDVISLNEIIKKFNIEKINFLKIDCEGAEYEIILKLEEEVLEKIEKISMEVHGGVGKHTINDLMKFLKSNGFKVENKELQVDDLQMIYAINQKLNNVLN
jgi:FkbM family methyltransferase